MLYVFIGCLAFGAVYAVASIVFGAHGLDHGVDGGANVHGHVENSTSDIPSPLNPVVIASAIATFGAVGVIGKVGFKLNDLSSSALALVFAGAIGAAIFFGIVKFMYGSQADSTYSLCDLEGTTAEIITPIPKDGLGEITYSINGVRYNLPARSLHGEEISRGTGVRIKEICSNIAVVARTVSIEEVDLSQFEKNDKNATQDNNIKGG